VDAVGAGDASTAALVLGLHQKMEFDEINTLADEVARHVCSSAGATPPLAKSFPNELPLTMSLINLSSNQLQPKQPEHCQTMRNKITIKLAGRLSGRWQLFRMIVLDFAMASNSVPVNPPGHYTEPLRPQFHFILEKSWMNDPDGLV
jgi:hypothetical protein